MADAIETPGAALITPVAEAAPAVAETPATTENDGQVATGPIKFDAFDVPEEHLKTVKSKGWKSVGDVLESHAALAAAPVQFQVGRDLGLRMRAEIAHGEAFQKLRPVRRPREPVLFQFPGEFVVHGQISAPELLHAPRAEGGGIDGADVRER